MSYEWLKDSRLKLVTAVFFCGWIRKTQMSAEKVQLVEVSENAAQRVTFKDGGKVKAKLGTKYLLKLDNSEVAPENVTVKRDGKDLLVFFQGSDKPDLVIQDFYADGMDSQLYGVSEDGQMYAYVRTDGEGFYSQLLLSDGEMAPIALGGSPLGAAPVVNGEIDESVGFLLWPLLAGAGLVGGVAAVTRNDDHHSRDTTPPDAPTVNVRDNGSGTITIDGKAERGSKVIIELPDGTTVTTSADAKGDYSIDVPAPKSDGDITVRAEDAAGNVSPPTVVPYHDITPPAAPTAEITDPGTGTITIDGKSEPGSKVIVELPDGTTATTTADANGDYSIDVPAPKADGDITVKAEDAAGNVSPDTDVPYKDITPPAAPTAEITDPATGTITIDGKSEPGSKVIIELPDGTTATTTADAGGDYSIDIPAPENSCEIQVRAEDAAGNKSLPTIVDYTDIIPPSDIPTVDSVIDNVAPIIGPISNGDSTNDPKPDFSGSGGEPSGKVNVYDNGALVATVDADKDGKWHYTPITDLSEGPHSYQFSDVDAAGNEGSKSQPFTFTVDTVAPTDVPTVDSVIDDVAPITGPISNGDSTNDPKPDFSGSGGEPNGKVNVYDNGALVATVDADKDGKWHYTPITDLSEGPHSFQFSDVDAAGNEGNISQPFAFTVDTTAPTDAPTLDSVIDDVAPITGPIANGDSTNDPKPDFSGSGAEPSSKVNIYDNGVLVDTVTAGADGKWKYTPTSNLDDKEHSFQFSDVDAAGNEGPKSAPFVFTVDTIAPTQSTMILDVDDNVAPVIGKIANNGYSNDTTPKLEGSISDALKAGEKVVVLRDGAVIGEASVTGTNWSFEDSGLQDGKAYTYTARVEDAAGNRGAISETFTLNIDTSAPTQTVVISTIWDDVAPGIGDVANGGSTNDSQPELKGSLSAGLEKNEVLVVYRDGQKVGNASVNGTSWNFIDQSGLADQHTYKYEARVEDAAGNTGSYSNAYSMTLELIGPPTTAEITAITDDVEPVTGVVAKDGYTNDADPSLSGTISQALTAGQSVEILRDGVKIGVADVTGTTWTYEDHNLVDGKVYSYTAQVVDGAGNPGAVSPAYVIHVDLSAPTQTVVLTNAIDDKGDETGPIKDGGFTDDDTPTLNGTISSALSGTEQVHVFRTENGVAKDVGVATVELKGGVWAWTYTDAGLANHSTYSYYAQVVDAAGNSSSQSNSLSFTLNTDTVGQSVTILSIEDDVLPVTGAVANGGYTNDTSPTLSGSISMALNPGDKVVILRNGEKVGDAVITGTTWTYQDSGLSNGSDYEYAAWVVNAAGTKGQESNHYVIHVDTVAPTATAAIVSYTDDVAPQMGDFLSGSTTNDTTPKLNGTVGGALGTGEVVAVYRDGVRLGAASLSADGKTWSYQDAGLVDGHTYTYTARVEDQAGNQGPISGNFSLIVDTTAPTDAPTLDSVIDDVAPITGPIANGDSTNDPKPDFSGSGAEPSSKVNIYDNGVLVDTVTAGADGKWKYTPTSNLDDKEHSFQFSDVDAAGNEGPKSAPFVFTVDTIAPTQSTMILDVDDNVAPVIGKIANNGYSNDTTPKLEGSISDALKAGEKVVVLRDGAVIGEASVTGTNWSFEDSGLQDGKAYTYTARVEDAAGNRGAISETFTLNIDTSAPTQTVVISTIWDDVAPGIGDVANGGSTNDSQPELKGSLSAGLEKNEVLVVYRDGQKVGNASVNGTSWNFIDQSGLADQHTYKYEARVEDAAGNTGSYSNAYSMTLELIGPPTTAEITAITDDVEPVTGVVAKDGYTNDADPSLSGTISQALTAGQSVEILRDGVKIGVADVTGTTWTYEDHNLVDGKVYSYTAQVVDGAGNPGAVSPAYVIHVDLSAPTQTVVLTEAIDNVDPEVGPIKDGGITNDDTPTLEGTISSPLSGTEQVHVFRNGADVGIAKVELKGGVWTWTYEDAGLSSGTSYTYYAKVVDAAGNTSANSNSLSFTVNTSTVGQQVNILSIEDDVLPVTGAVANGGYTNDTSPTLSGSISMALTAGDKVVIQRDGVKVGEAIVTGTTWTFEDKSLVNGTEYSYTALVVNSAGTEGALSNAYVIHVDTVAPTATAAIVSYTDDVAPQMGDFLSGSTTNDTTPKLNGTVGGALGTGEVVAVYRDGVRLGAASLSADGKTWSYQDAGLVDGHTYTYTARVEDQAGNQGPISGNFSLIVDTTAPTDAPTLDSVIDDVAPITGPIANGDSTNDPKPTFSGSAAEPNSTVNVYDNGQLIGSVKADADGKWSYEPNPKLDDGDHRIQFSDVDAAGNEGPKSAPFAFNVDTIAPTQSTAILDVDDNVAPVIGKIANNGYSNDTTPKLEGTISDVLKAGEKVVVLRDGAAIGDATVTGTNWSFEDSGLQDGNAYTYTARVEDAAGNRGAISADFTLNIDTSAPTQTVVISTIWDDVAPGIGDVANGGSTNDSQPELKGSLSAGLEKNEVLVVYRDGQKVGNASVNGTSWNFIDQSGLADQHTYKYEARVEDAAGNTGSYSNAYSMTLELIGPPTTAEITAITDDVEPVTGVVAKDGYTNDADPSLSGTISQALTSGQSVEILRDGVKIGVAVVTGTTWTYEDHNLVDGKAYSYTAHVVDGAGNPGADSAAYVIHIDLSVPPQTVVLTEAIDNKGDETGAIKNGGTTDDDTPTLNGTISSTLSGTEQVHVFRAEVKEDGTSVPAKDIGVATVELKGGVWTWTYTDASLSNHSQYTYFAQVVDAAGNASAASNSLGFTLNTDNVPQAVEILSIEDAVLPVVGKVDSGGYTNDTNPTLKGSISMVLAAGDKVEIWRNGEKAGDAVVAGTTWTYQDRDLKNGSDYEYVAKVVNSAGNKSQESNHYIIHVDTAAPTAIVTIVNYTDDVAPQTGDFLSGSTTNDPHPKLNGTVMGTLGNGEGIVVYRDGERLGVARLSADKTTWSYQDAGLLDGHTYTYTARAEDQAGNQGQVSGNFVINVDIYIPTTASTITQITDDTGVSEHDFITQDRTLLISGQVESELLPGQKVQFSSDGGATWKDATLDNDRVRWTYDNRAVSLADGTYTFETRVVSAAGTAGPISTQAVVIDNSQPTNKVTFALDPASDNGVSNTDNITSIMTPTINGTVKSGSHKLEDLTITLFWDKNGNNQIDPGEDIYGQGIKINSDGTWRTDLWSLHYGDYLLKAVATTASGVTGSASYVGSLDDQNHILTITQSVPQHYYGAKQGGFEFGWDVVNIGDFNGDGIDDLLVSARNSDTLGRTNNGGAWILYGSENGLPVLDQNMITNLKPSQGIFFAGAYNNDIIGSGINALGDFNGDGYNDVIISSHWPDKIYVIFGGPNNSWGTGTVDLATIDAGDNTHGFVIRNPGVSTSNPSAPGYDSWNGIGVGGGGDFNGDGYTDLLFGNREAGPNNSGAGYVLYGGANVNKNIVMDWSNPATGTGSSQTWAHFPTGVNGTTITNSFTGTVTNSSQVNGVDLGDSINNVGDVNGDGIDDFVIADPRANNVMSQGYAASAGTAYLVYGKAGGLGSSLDLANMTLDQGIRINSQHYEWLGSARQDYSTNTITALGDINGDGIGDFAIAAPYSEPGDPGRVWVIYGKAGGYTSDINLDALNTVGVPSQFNTNPMFDSSVGSLILNEKATYNSATGKWTQSTVDEWFGVSIRAGGDINGDGINDFIIGARYADRPGMGNGDNSGAVYVVYGTENGLPAIWSIKDVINDPTKGYALYGEGAGFELGNGVAMGDWNGDGMMDIATGAYNADFTATDSGAMYVYYSSSDSFTKKYTSGDDYLVADGKDENGNPVNDYIVGGFGNDTIMNIGTMDFANGGEGNDFIHIVSTDFLGVNGGSGTDTLVFDGQGMNINLAVMKNKVISFEKFDLGQGGNSLTVKLDDVLRMGESDLMFKDGKKQLVVNGDTSGNVDLVKTGITWTESSATGNDGHAYKVYSSGTGEVWVEDQVQVHLVG